MLERQWAEHLIQQHWMPRPVPVDPTAIAQGLDVEVMPSTPFDKDLGSGASGSFAYENGKPTIRYNMIDPPNRQRFTIAHELGHHVLGHAVGGRRFRDTSATLAGQSYDPVETSANRFAAELLMPIFTMKLLVEERRISSISQLANIFSVSEKAMHVRLKSLGYIN